VVDDVGAAMGLQKKWLMAASELASTPSGDDHAPTCKPHDVGCRLGWQQQQLLWLLHPDASDD